MLATTDASAAFPEARKLLRRLSGHEPVSREYLAECLAWRGTEAVALRQAARLKKLEELGSGIYLRGLIEWSNRCAKNCYYCGIRRDNRRVVRYRMEETEVLEAARFACDHGYGSIVLQSGELEGTAWTASVTRLLEKIHAATGATLRVTLSLGEQSRETYRSWHEAGAHRYLLRMETTNPRLYQSLHPADHSYLRRLDCLKGLREEGYQVGTGVMIGLPGQSLNDLAGDLLFFRDQDVDMLGMGPFIAHADTPLVPLLHGGKAQGPKDAWHDPQERMETSLNMVALARLLNHGINIAATTAMQALRPDGREQAVLAGANVIMPNLTPAHHRENYQLYDGKPCVSDTPQLCHDCLGRRLWNVGERLALGEWGDAMHFHG